MSKFTPLPYEDFVKALTAIGAKANGQEEFLYSIYSYTVEGIEGLVEDNIFSNLQGINHLELIGYVLGEVMYFISLRNKEDLEVLKQDEKVIMSVSSIVADKYLSLTQFSYNAGSLISRFDPQISTLYVYVNFMLNILENFNKNDPQTSLMTDLFMKSISICKCTLDLLTRGFETEAFTCWRTLHECECTSIILFNNKIDVAKAYLRHMQFGLAFKDTISDKDKQTEIFMAMKEEMKQFDLKSKDIKKYIEYGWLYSVPGVKEDPDFKLNFRDGLEKVANLTMYSKRYEMSSEIIHGTPLLVYSNREYFYFMTLLSTYESFFRLEQIFSNIFSQISNEVQLKSYLQMRNVYYAQLVNIHKRESERFIAWQKAHQ